jgi:hypothetical protein
VFADPVGPPGRLSGHKAHATTPFRSGHRRPLNAVEPHFAEVRIEIGDGAKKQGLAGAGRSAQRHDLACGNSKVAVLQHH